jgi:cell division protein DivIC
MKKNEKALRRIKIYIFIIIILLAFFCYKTYYYWPKIVSNYNEKNNLEKKYKELLEKEDTLNNNIIKLQDPNYIARFAREKYLYSKEGEIIIKIVE